MKYILYYERVEDIQYFEKLNVCFADSKHGHVCDFHEQVIIQKKEEISISKYLKFFFYSAMYLDVTSS